MSSSETSTGEETMFALFSRAQPVNISAGNAIAAAPLTTVYNTVLALMEPQTSHATSSEGPFVGNYSNPALDKIKEGSTYVDRAIRRLVSRVLNEDIHVAGISRPLSQIVPPTYNDEVEQITDSSKSDDSDNNLHKFVDSVLKTTRARGEGNTEASSARGSHPSNQDELGNKTVNPIVNVIDLSSDDELIKSVNSRIAKRLRTRKGKVMADTNSPKPKQKQVTVGSLKALSKVSVSSKKRKIRTKIGSEDDIGDVQDITRVKKTVTKQSSVNVPDAPMENISFHSIDSVGRWKFVYQRRITMERELGQDALKIKETMDLISDSRLIKTVVGFAKCYEVLVKEFVVNIPVDCADPGSQNFRKIYARGKCVHFSPTVINRYLGRSENEGCDLEVTDNQV
ncbi:uncharacterized protein LOC131593172 [Vicia villosa]|uniref:uncharacterized protein LOC131593172 n=1 Tax=Vicia villosa TaxID=3911 RepID=UPI00273B5A26|nr:uncharacterized protein LOC131593172 [Vicia villosa]